MSGDEVSRRGLLGAVVAVSFETPVRQAHRLLRMSGGAVPLDRWKRALARLQAAEAEVRAVERATAGKPAEEEEALQAVYDARLGDHRAAVLRLMKVRAPDLPALALKIELAIDQEVGTLSGGEVCLAVLKRDVRRRMR